MAPRTDPAVATTAIAFRDALDVARAAGRGVALVPTMGALHAGHLALVDRARTVVGDEGFVAVTIFVNPTQFGPNEDFSKYPRELESDRVRCAEAGVNVVFAPESTELYPPGEQTRVRVGPLAEPLCGAFRPGHFEGVATIVAKLFALTGPCTAVFGRKDYQQWRILDRLARDLMLPVRVLACPTVREGDGLALSSRNRYLDATVRARALAIPRALGDAARAWNSGDRDVAAIRARASEAIGAAADRVDYVDARDPITLAEIAASPERVLLAVAARFAGTRLIDNVVLGEDPAPM